MGLPVLLFSLLVKLEFMCNHNNRKILKAGGCGGPPGYEHLLEALADPDHEDHDERLE
jgi:hypothetical protein